MAYYVGVRSGSDSLMDDRLSLSATLSSQRLRSVIRGLIALLEMELKETHRIVFTVKDATGRVGRSAMHCPLEKGTTGTRRWAFDRIAGSAVEGTRILQVLATSELAGDTGPRFCLVCEEKV
jgi:hypothetical protein